MTPVSPEKYVEIETTLQKHQVPSDTPRPQFVTVPGTAFGQQEGQGPNRHQRRALSKIYEGKEKQAKKRITRTMIRIAKRSKKQ